LFPPPDNNWYWSAAIGAGLSLFGLLLLFSHRRTWRRQQSDETMDAFERAHLEKRYRRRMQTSGMIAILGAAIGAGDFLVWRLGPLAATVFWIGVLLTALWIMLLGFGDLAAARAHFRVSLARTRLEQERLRQQAAELRERRLNGEPPP
jgi:hypothetical protein